MKILVPTETIKTGTVKKVFSDPETSELFYGSFRTFGGTEYNQNGMFTLLTTATIECWYRPDIQANCRIYICETNETYEIIGEPEDINMRHQYLKFKVKKVGGKS